MTSPYLFGTYQSAPSPFAHDPHNPNATAPFPLTDFVASDSDLTGPDFAVTLSPGSVLGLAHVTYSVAGATPIGTVTVSFGASGTSLADVEGNAIPFQTASGNISTVPEPASVDSFVLGLAGAALIGPIRQSHLESSLTRRPSILPTRTSEDKLDRAALLIPIPRSRRRGNSSEWLTSRAGVNRVGRGKGSTVILVPSDQTD